MSDVRAQVRLVQQRAHDRQTGLPVPIACQAFPTQFQLMAEPQQTLYRNGRRGTVDRFEIIERIGWL